MHSALLQGPGKTFLRQLYFVFDSRFKIVLKNVRTSLPPPRGGIFESHYFIVGALPLRLSGKPTPPITT